MDEKPLSRVDTDWLKPVKVLHFEKPDGAQAVIECYRDGSVGIIYLRVSGNSQGIKDALHLTIGASAAMVEANE
jgi:hypothetical protein